jgi:hypothetical protein
MTVTTYIRIPFPPPTLPPGADPCDGCLGLGVTGDSFTRPVGADRMLLLDVVCPGCDGCGAASHEGCAPGVHALEDVVDRDGCHLCGGRGWSAVPGWSANPDGETVLMRVPCACQESRAERVAPEAVSL